MHLIPKLTTFSLLLFCSIVIAQNTYQPDTTGYVNFNLGNTTLPHTEFQPVFLYGCNTNITINNKFWYQPNGLKWDQDNQVISGIPFGHQKDNNGEEFYVSKYYIASPPVIKKGTQGINDPSTLYDIGLVIPDKFNLEGEKPMQIVHLDYNTLKLMHIRYIPIEFDASFEELGVDFVPFKVECNDFPWIAANQVTDAKGASGIGALSRSATTNKDSLFLPYYYPKNAIVNTTPETKKYLDCKVTILNDILFHYEVFFLIDGVKHTSINLKDYTKKKQNQTITLYSEYRKELPCGCTEPKVQDPYKKY